MLAGVLPLSGGLEASWRAAAGWQLPVGSPGRLGTASEAGEPAFAQLRGVEWRAHRAVHQGADLGNGRAGDPVRAAAGGVVAVAEDGEDGGGYGGHVVIAHRLESGRTVFTVYAHLAAGSLAVHPGDVVSGGDRIASVGQTGRASTPHLHFEVRLPAHEDEVWQTSRVTNPVAFVLAHAGDGESERATDPARADVGAYLRWATAEDIVAQPPDTAAALSRGAWWSMLARVTGHAGSPEAAPAGTLRDRLIEAGVLPEEAADAPAQEPLPWRELARDVARVHRLHLELPRGPLTRAAHEASCRRELGARAPAAHASALRKRPGEPSLADACLVLADLGGPRPAPHGRHHRTRSHRASGAPGA